MAPEGTLMGFKPRGRELTMRPSFYLRAIKPVMDSVLVLLTLPVVLPLVLFLALLVRLDSPGPAFLRLNCVGLNGAKFRQWRFRCIRMDAAVVQFKAETTAEDGRDLRLTRMGRFLIRTQLNTLPQIFNVLSGDMSLVGPAAECCKTAQPETAIERVILQVRPGIFSPEHLAEARGLNRADRRSLVLAYVAEAGIATDLRVLLKALLGKPRG